MHNPIAPIGGDIIVRQISDDDVDQALDLSCAAGWNQRAEDWRMLIRLSDGSSFAALAGERVVGTAIGIDYGAFSWIAMMLVDPAFRGRGLGARLLEAALEAVPDETPVRLDATPMGRPLYQKFGFVDETAILRCTCEPVAESWGGGEVSGGFDARPLAVTDFAAVMPHDREVFGADRSIVLEWALDAAPAYARVIESSAAGTPAQYCFGRPGRLFDQIGPVVAANEEAARSLVEAARSCAHGKSVVIDAFEAREGFADWLRSRGFREQRPLFRMRRWPHDDERRSGVGGPIHRADRSPLMEFAILGPDFA